MTARLRVPAEDLAAFLERQRWFAGGGRGFRVGEVEWHHLESGDGWELHDALVDVRHDDGEPATYQVPLGVRSADAMPAGLLEGQDAARIGLVDTALGRSLVYDAVHDPELDAVWLDLLAAGAQRGGLAFEAADDVVGRAGRLLGADQSNSSLVYGDEHILKIYRRVTSDPHPEVEVAQALTDVGSGVIAPVTGRFGTASQTLGLLQPFYRSATDGWALALGSVRSCLAHPLTAPEDDGADFAADAERLGATAAQLHADLLRALPSGTASDIDTKETIAQLHERLSTALTVVPALAAHRDAISAAYDAVEAAAREVNVQRIHGDFHLGQLLRIDTGWVVLDFEGEPARPVEERRALMSPLRDVAGMLRSLDYAAQHLLAEGSAAPETVAVAEEWALRNRAAFCDGYAAASGRDPRDDAVLLTAFELDKAVYEVLYETRHRPTWLPIPLTGIARLVG